MINISNRRYKLNNLKSLEYLLSKNSKKNCNPQLNVFKRKYNDPSFVLNQLKRGFHTVNDLNIVEKEKTTIDKKETIKFQQINWDGAEGKALREMHKTRMGIIARYLQKKGLMGDENEDMTGISVLDVGCGPGLVSKYFMERNAKVVAIDAVAENVQYTKDVIKNDKNIDNKELFEAHHTTAEEFLKKNGEGSYDLVVSLEVIEHVSNQKLFVESLCKLSKGALAISTISRTPISYALAIVAAEDMFGLVPRGTHDWFKFVCPTELETMINNSNGNIHCNDILGMVYNPVFQSWHMSQWNHEVNYIALASKLDT